MNTHNDARRERSREISRGLMLAVFCLVLGFVLGFVLELPLPGGVWGFVTSVALVALVLLGTIINAIPDRRKRNERKRVEQRVERLSKQTLEEQERERRATSKRRELDAEAALAGVERERNALSEQVSKLLGESAQERRAREWQERTRSTQ